MRIVDIEIVKEHEGYMNEGWVPVVTLDGSWERPSPHLWTDIPGTSQQNPKRRIVYWAEDSGSGLVDYILENPNDRRGYGGAKTTLTIIDGIGETEHSFVGGWSSRSSVMNHIGFPSSLECLVKPDRDKDRVQLASAIRVSTVKHWIADHDLGFKVSFEQNGDDDRYFIVEK